jgi:hypothetical protein
MQSLPYNVVRRSGVLSRKTVRASGPVRLPPLIIGLALLAAFAMTSVLAAANPYSPFDIPLERASSCGA